MKTKKILFASFLLLLPFSAFSVPTAPRNEKEIAALIDFVKTSSCRFNRNGSWHEASEAAWHIDKKYHYALDKDLVHSAEDFIQHAASKSSLSGTPYTVQCQGGPVLRCADWLRTELRRIRNQ